MGFVEIVRDALGLTALEKRIERAEFERERAVRERDEVDAQRRAAERETERLTDTVRALAANAQESPQEPEFRPCGCGAVSMRVDLLTASLCVQEGRLVRRETGAMVTCARCGRHWAIDAEGVYVPHRSAWPSPWVVEEQLALQAEAREQQREAARGMRARRNGSGVAGDMRFPPS